MKRIVFEQNGVAAIMVPSPRWQGTIEELAAKDLPDGVDFDIVDETEISSDRTFRNAWVHDKVAKGVKIDMTKAKEIAHEKRRAKRDAGFAPLDVKATIPSEADKAESARQAIRDADAVVQAGIDAAATPEELKILLENYGTI